MNTLLVASRGLRPIVDAPEWVVLLLKITAILLAAWVAHLALKRANPRWRVFLWRVTTAGLIALPAVAWLLPALQIRVQPPPLVEEAVTAPTAPQILPSPFGRGAGSEGGVLVDSGSPDKLPFGREAADEGHRGAEKVDRSTSLPKALTQTLSQGERGLRWIASNTKKLLLAVWLGGMVVLAFRLCLGHYRICRIVRRAKPAPQRICGGCLRVAEAVGCRTRVELLQSADVSSPFLCGLRRPLLLLPARDVRRFVWPGLAGHSGP